MERPWLAHYDDGVPATLAPYPQQTLVDIVKATAAERPRHTAAIFKGARLSYGELNGLSDGFAAWLAARGVVKGDRVALLMPNCPQVIIAQLGVWKAGAVAVARRPEPVRRRVAHAHGWYDGGPEGGPAATSRRADGGPTAQPLVPADPQGMGRRHRVRVPTVSRRWERGHSRHGAGGAKPGGAHPQPQGPERSPPDDPAGASRRPPRRPYALQRHAGSSCRARRQSGLLIGQAVRLGVGAAPRGDQAAVRAADGRADHRSVFADRGLYGLRRHARDGHL